MSDENKIAIEVIVMRLSADFAKKHLIDPGEVMRFATAICGEVARDFRENFDGMVKETTNEIKKRNQHGENTNE